MLLLLSNIYAEETDIELDGLFTPEVFASKSKNSFLVDRPAPITPEYPRPLLPHLDVLDDHTPIGGITPRWQPCICCVPEVSCRRLSCIDPRFIAHPIP
jgi:hypothetical protein